MITPEQRQRRQKHLGSSDMPVIMGLYPYSTTPNDVYWSKVSPLPADDGEDYLTIGNYMEKVLIRFAADELGQEVLHEKEEDLYHVGANPLFAANLDGLLADRSAAVECKYCNAEYAQGYGDEGSDQVPDHVLIQCQHQMYCAGLDRVYVAVAMAGYSLSLRLFHVDRDPEIIQMIVDFGSEWWKEHVEAQVPPEEVTPMYVLKAKQRVPFRAVDLDASLIALVDQFYALKAQGKDVETQAEHLKARIIDALGDAEIGHLPDGRMLTYQQYSRSGFDKKRFEREHPQLATQYATRSFYRTLYVKTAKKKSA